MVRGGRGATLARRSLTSRVGSREQIVPVAVTVGGVALLVQAVTLPGTRPTLGDLGTALHL
jgi:hypothetical protein